nr:TonB-dependent hemoglobin/transferrin/lactoferrin family receptor [uncultured Brevundimonas sp.]
MRNLLLLTTAATAFSAALGAPPAFAEDAAKTAPTQLDPITVIATRTERRVDSVPATVTVITSAQIDALLSTDIKDLVRYEPGVSVQTAPSRFSATSGAGRDGNAGFTIRGMGGNRVLMVSDGVRLPDSFAFGGQNVGRGGYNDLDFIKSVEILRGPASALYGSDGVAGAVSFTTKDPVDFLDAGRDFGARARVGYNSADEGWSESIALAGRSGAFSGLVAYSRRDFRETENKGDATGEAIPTGATLPDYSLRTLPNPQDFASNAVLGKLVWQATPNHILRLTYDHYDLDMDGQSLSGRTAVATSRTPRIQAITASDETRRDRISADWRFSDVLGLDQGQVSAYWQDSTNKQYTFEQRVTVANVNADRSRTVTFDNTAWGLAAHGTRSLDLGGVGNRITAGADYSHTRQEGVRDGLPAFSGSESFPVRAFPNTDYALAGAYVQDEIQLGRLSIIPAVRYDWYELTPKPDALYTGVAKGQSDDHFSPKLGLLWQADDHFSLFANYASGFKAPSPMQVNNFFANAVANYTSIPNPDLKPETSTSYEAGMRFRNIAAFGGALSLSGTAFHAEYENFIDQIQVAGDFSPANPAVYQYVNLTGVKIWGLEGRGEVRWDNGFSVQASAAFADGEQTTNGAKTDLATVDPIKLVGGLNYADPSGRFGGSAIVTWSAAKPAGDYAGSLNCGRACYLGDSFTLLDLTAYWNVTDAVTARAGVFNVFDETYAWWSDMRGVAASSAIKDAYTQPGRNFGLSLSLRL